MYTSRKRPPSVTPLSVNPCSTKRNIVVQAAAPTFPIQAQQPAVAPAPFQQTFPVQAPFQPACPVQAQQPVISSAPAHFQAQPLIGPAAPAFPVHVQQPAVASVFQPAFSKQNQPKIGGGAFQAPSTLAASKEFQVPSAPTNDQHTRVSLDIHPSETMVTTPLKFANRSPTGLRSPTPVRPSSSASTLSGLSPTAQF